MTPDKTQKLMVVMSNQFGELGMAYNFLSGLQRGWEVTVFLPESLFKFNDVKKGYKSVLYVNDTEIFSYFDSYQPDALIFFSAYLLITDRLFSIRSLEKLLHKAVGQGVVLATSDPFLGHSSNIVPSRVNPFGPSVNPPFSFAKKVVVKHLFCFKLKKIDRLLASLPKLSLTYNHTSNSQQHFYCFYNPGYLEKTEFPTISLPYWIFVISGLDLSCQYAKHGESNFADLLVARISDVVSMGICPVLCAPADLLAKLADRLPMQTKILDTTDIESFNNAILHAQRCFYWNMISNSLYLNIMLQKPVHFFDRGHLHALLPDMHVLAMKHYFGGYEPALIDFRKMLVQSVLEQDQAAFIDHQKGTVEAIRAYPDSITLLKHLSTSRGT